jgi:HEAT repeat protein
MRLCKLLTATLMLTGILGIASSTLYGADERLLEACCKGKTIAELIQDLRTRDAKKIMDASFSLHLLGVYDPEIVPALRRILQDKDEETRLHAIIELGNLGSKGAPAVPELTHILQHDEKENLRSNVVSSFGLIGPRAEAAVPLLIGCLASQDHLVRGNAAFSLGKIGPASSPAMPALRKALHDQKAFVRAHVALALWRIGKEKAPLAPLVEDLQSNDFGDYVAAMALGEMGPSAKEAIPELLKILMKVDKGKRPNIALAIWKIDKKQPIINVLLDTLKVGGFTAQIVCQILGEMGPAAKEAGPDLLKVAKGTDATLHLAAAEALWQISQQEDSISVLIPLLKDKKSVAGAAEILGYMGPPANEAVPAMVAALATAEGYDYCRVAGALRKIDPQAALKAGIK